MKQSFVVLLLLILVLLYCNWSNSIVDAQNTVGGDGRIQFGQLEDNPEPPQTVPKKMKKKKKKNSMLENTLTYKTKRFKPRYGKNKYRFSKRFEQKKWSFAEDETNTLALSPKCLICRICKLLPLDQRKGCRQRCKAFVC